MTTGATPLSNLDSLARRTSLADDTVLAAGRGMLPLDSVALVAVGGYGRRELFPYSDIDLLILVPQNEVPKPLRDAIAAFLQTLWDSRLRLSQSVRTVEECTTLHENNIELNTSLLDSRFLGGSEALYGRFSARFPDFLKQRGQTLARRLADLTRLRHAKYQGTIYHLEPDLKETPGALRDLHVVRWLERLQNAADPPGSLLDEAFALLGRLRLGMHEWSKRDDNLLTFEAQDALSGSFRSPEDLMRAYYRRARDIFGAVTERIELAENRDSSGMLSQFRSWRSRLSTSEFTVSRERVLARSPQLLESDTGLVLRLFEFVGRHGLKLAPDTERRLARYQPTASGLLAWEQIQSLLALPKPAAALRAMNASGVLKTILPEWAAIECLVVRDFFHRYTVDEHTIVAIETLEDMRDARFRNLHEETSGLELLRAALLFHDIGKGAGENHEQRSRDIAAAVLARWSADESTTSTILFLIENHLILSQVISKRDLADPATVNDLATRIGTVEMLRLLTLMTFADISAVFPGAMTPWRAEQLWHAYVSVHEELTRDLEKDRIHVAANRSGEEAVFLEGLPVRYQRTHTEAQIQAHIQLARQAGPNSAAVSLERHHGVWQAVVITQDRPFLFASLAGALAGFGMNILKAEAFANARGVVVDTFAFADPHRTLELNPEELTRLRKVLAAVSTGKEDVRRLLSGRRPSAASHRLNRVVPTVTFSNDVVPAATLLEIVAGDRPGLLYELANAISRAGCDIEVVLIDTEAHRALDVFYLKHGASQLPGSLQHTLRDTLASICSGAAPSAV